MARSNFLMFLIPLAVSLSACSTDGRSFEERAYESFESRHYLDTRIHLANAIQEDPENPALRRLLGETALAMGDAQMAATAFHKAIEKDASLAAEISPFLAHAHLMQGEPEEALALIGETRQGEPYVLRLLAQARLQNGELVEAWETIEQAIASAPEDSNILSLAGQYQLSVGNIGEADKYAGRALASPEPSVEAYLLKGRIHSIREELGKAIEQYDAGIEHFRDHVRLYIAQAAIYADLQDTVKMETAIANVERISPGHRGAIYIMARYAMNEGDIDKAFELTQLLESASSNNPPLLLLRGQIQVYKGNIQQAITHLRAFLRLSPNHPAASLLLANVLAENGDVRGAYTVITGVTSRASSSKPIIAYAAYLAKQLSDPTAPLLARRAAPPPLEEVKDQLVSAQRSMSKGDWKAAANVYEALISKKFSDHAMLLNNAAMANLRAGNEEKALELAERAYELTPDDPSVLDSVGWIRLNVAEDKAGSLGVLRRAFQLDPTNMQIRLHLAQALAINGDGTEARGHLERLIAVVDGDNQMTLREILAKL